MSTAHIVVGICYGDEGKGSQVDYLCRATGARMVVRFNGACQAAHNVVLADGRHHTFSQIGSGAFAGAKTYLSRYMLIEPMALIRENEVLAPKIGHSVLKDVFIESGCPIITPYHWLANQARERVRGNNRHGSCGRGVGEVRADQIDNQFVLTAEHLADWDYNKRYVEMVKLRERKRQEIIAFGGDPQPLMDYSLYDLLYRYERFPKKVTIVPNGSLGGLLDGPVIMESAQGVLLDEKYGSAPHNTWTNTTFDNALKLVDGLGMDVVKVGVVRTYMTRHGAGPFVTEFSTQKHYPEPHNETSEFQGSFRQGFFDATAVRYAIECCGGVDQLALTHCDRVGDCFTYSDVDKPVDVFHHRPEYQVTKEALSSLLPKILGVDIGWASHGPTAEDKQCMTRMEQPA